MNRQMLHSSLLGWFCIFSVGCSAGLQRGSANRASEPAENGRSGDAAFLDEASTSVPMASTIMERRIAALIDRVLSRAAPSRGRQAAVTSPWAKQSPHATDRGSASRQANRVQREMLKPVAGSERSETLRVSSASGDLCAAVSISSQLAVTALHCVQALCESELAPIGASLLGCRLNYEIPDGTSGEATVVTTSENDLLALLDLHRPLSKYSALRCDDPRTDDRVYTVGHPNGDSWLVAYGWLTREPISLEWVDGQATRVLVAQIPTKHGSSGGGLFDVQDRVVGVQIARWSSWSTDYGKAAFIQATRIYNMAGRYCMKHGSSACVGLRCMSKYYDVWRY